MSCMTETREQTWNNFLACLSPHELHWLLRGERELHYHDLFVAGECDLGDMEQTLTDAFGTYTPTSTRVD